MLYPLSYSRKGGQCSKGTLYRSGGSILSSVQRRQW